MPHTKQTETATVGRMNWVEAATQGSAPQGDSEPAPEPTPATPPEPTPEGWPAAYEQPQVNVQAIAIYHGLLTLEQVTELRDWLAAHGFDGEVVTWGATTEGDA